jgi:rhodanese-related sulfurtransferase
VRVTRILILVVLAVLSGAVSNLTASRERRLAWVGGYSPAARADGSGRGDAGTPGRGDAAKSSSAESPPTSAGTTFPPHPDKPWVEISGDDVAVLHQRGDVPFLDARRTSVYRDGHVSGARPFSVWESDIDDKVKAFFDEGHDSSGVIVVYCSGGDCEDSHTLAQKLYMAGFDDVLVYKDGFPDWEKRGLAVTKGDKP